MPPHHRKQREVLGWNSDYFLEKAERIGTSTGEVIRTMLSSSAIIEQSYHSCLGIIRLAEKVGHQRMDVACRRALQGRKITYTIIKTILDKNLDSIEQQEDIQFSLPFHENLRGNQAYQ